MMVAVTPILAALIAVRMSCSVAPAAIAMSVSVVPTVNLTVDTPAPMGAVSLSCPAAASLLAFASVVTLIE